jgi:hypothetical protein
MGASHDFTVPLTMAGIDDAAPRQLGRIKVHIGFVLRRINRVSSRLTAQEAKQLERSFRAETV